MSGKKQQNIRLYGYEKYNNIKCAVAEFKWKDLELKTRIWIDKDRGTCLKTVNTGIDSEGEQYEYINEYIVTYDIVTDEEVKKPDLIGYTEIVQE
jgi:hypothetical protein